MNFKASERKRESRKCAEWKRLWCECVRFGFKLFGGFTDETKENYFSLVSKRERFQSQTTINDWFDCVFLFRFFFVIVVVILKIELE